MEQEQPIGIKSKNYSLDIEWTIRDIFNCDRFGMGGIADSDFIKSSPYMCMVSTLMYIFKEKDIVKQEKIKKFIEKYSYYSNHTIEEIIQEVNEKEFKDIKNDFDQLAK